MRRRFISLGELPQAAEQVDKAKELMLFGAVGGLASGLINILWQHPGRTKLVLLIGAAALSAGLTGMTYYLAIRPRNPVVG